MDPNLGKIIMTIESPLIAENPEEFKNRMNEIKILKNLEVGIDDSGTAVVSFSLNSNQFVVNGKKVAVSSECMKPISIVLDNFVSHSLRERLKKTEFIPLRDYPDDSLKEDVQAAVKEKRDFCLIKNYAEFLEKIEMEKSGKFGDYAYTQYEVEYGTLEYADVAIRLYKGELNELRKEYEPKLERVYWV